MYQAQSVSTALVKRASSETFIFRRHWGRQPLFIWIDLLSACKQKDGHSYKGECYTEVCCLSKVRALLGHWINEDEILLSYPYK